MVSLDREGEIPRIDEKILGYFECYMDNMRGFLIPTETKLKFVQGGGRYDNKDQETLDLDYRMIKEISWDDQNFLSIQIKNTEKRKKVEPIDNSLQLLEKILRKWVQPEISEDDYCSSDHHVTVEM